MRQRPLAGLLEKPFDVDVELVAIDSPYAASAKLYCRQFPRAHQRVDLRSADIEVPGGLLEGIEARVHLDFFLLSVGSFSIACHSLIMGQESYVC